MKNKHNIFVVLLTIIYVSLLVMMWLSALNWYNVAKEEQENANKWHDKYVASEKALKLYKP